MSSKPVSDVMLVLLVTSILVLAVKIQSVKAEGTTIIINANGSITPSIAPIYTADNITYTLTGNIAADANGIVIERDNIVLDGAGYALQGSGASLQSSEASNPKGIELTGRSNVTIKNMEITAFGYGIYLNSSSYESIKGNNITAANSEMGILVEYSSNNTLSSNNITANNEYGIFLYTSSNNIINGNNITANGPGIYLASSSNNDVSGNVFVGCGLWFDDSGGCVVVDNLVNGRPLVYLEDVSDVVVKDAGQVVLINCTRMTVENLNLSNTSLGVQLFGTNYTTISGNNITNDEWGLFLYSSNNNSICGNNISGNNGIGLYLYSSNNNSIYLNNFASNKQQQVDSPDSTNLWDNGYPSGGNYWSDYLTAYPNATEVDNSGVWNTPYVIDANNIDHYPLMTQYVIPEFPSFLILSLLLIATLVAVIVYKKKGLITSQARQNL